MNKLILTLAIAFGLIAIAGTAEAQRETEVQRRSDQAQNTFPKPFQVVNNPHNSPAISTGYYFVESGNPAPDFWQPKEQIYDLEVDPDLWRRVVQGPRIQPKSVWENNPEGLPFFRNPALPAAFNGDFFQFDNLLGTDSTDDAIAGPIPIRLTGPFYFNGIRYDSFYVSTNGVVALTNRRYYYDENGQRQIPTGSTNAYDPMSMDWFVGAIGADNYNRKGNGLPDNDAQADDFGYKYAVLGGAPTNAQGGIRGRGGSLTQSEPSPAGSPFQLAHKAALIAPFFGDNHLSQFHAEANLTDDHGQVHYKRQRDGSRLIIFFRNIAPVRAKATMFGNYTAAPDLRPGEGSYTSASAQVVLNRLDSTVTILYQVFAGAARVAGRNVPAADVFRYNASAGVRGFARHINFNRTGGPVPTTAASYPWAAEYEQYTHYYNFNRVPAAYPRTRGNVIFKQWKNTLRVVDIQYRIRPQQPNAGLDFTVDVPSSAVNNYELLAGDERLGAIQPVALIQNLSNDIQGLNGRNYTRQDLQFQARFRIVNQATGRIVYNRIVPIDSLCLAVPEDKLVDCNGNPDVRVRFVNVTETNPDFKTVDATFPGINPSNNRPRNGISPYQFVKVFFPPFEPNELLTDNNGKLSQVGRMRAFIIAEPQTVDASLNDEWPFDDTASVQLFVMKRLESFNDDVTEYHLIDNVPMPSVYKWVNIDATVANGEIVSRHPLPPRGLYTADNNEFFTRNSPVIQMDRKDLNGFDHAPNPVTGKRGDQIRSFPIDLRGRFGAVLSLSIQRVANRDNWDRGYGDGMLIGPEPRTLFNNDRFDWYDENGLSAAQRPDEIVVEFARPSDDGVQNITNVQAARWRNMPRRGGAQPETANPALTVFGAGGRMIGFLEQDPDSVLARPVPAQGLVNGLRADFYDDGIDFEYRTYFVPIPDTIINWRAEGARNFRFRIKVEADDDQKSPLHIPDDNDDFFVDNVRILFRSREQTDIGVTAVKIDWPYTQAPATQASSIPVLVKVTNNTSTNAPSYQVKVQIFRGANAHPARQSAASLPVYCRTVTVPVHDRQRELELTFPRWDARSAGGPGEYIMYAMVGVPGGDLDEFNDTTFSIINLNLGPNFAFDPISDDPTNNVPAFLGVNGRGLNIQGFAFGGNASANNSGTFDNFLMTGGVPGGSISGQIAMKFELNVTDTIFGYDAMFGIANAAPSFISWRVYQDGGNIPGGQVVQGTYLEGQRGRDADRDPNQLYWDEYVRYRLPQGVVLEGNRAYWIAISQLEQTGLELAASQFRGGMRTMNINVAPPIFVVKAVGEDGRHLNIHKEFRQFNPQRNLLNKNFFALENTATSGNWNQFMPSVGNPAYPHLSHFGRTTQDPGTLTMTRGFWVPMIRPFLGNKAFSTGAEVTFFDCDNVVPVELVDFRGEIRGSKADLTWETASEVNNYGFYIEKRIQTSEEVDNWNQIGFVRGAGNSNSSQYYVYTDEDLKANTTYEYRLRQVDFDGTQSCNESQVVVLTYEAEATMMVNQNSPNPFSDMTSITFTIPEAAPVSMEVIDLYGNTVANIISNEAMPAGTFNVTFDGTSTTGAPLPSGTYIYRLVAGERTASSKMTIIR